MSKSSYHTGVLFTCLSAIALSVIGLLGKIGSEKMPISSLIFWRYFLGFFFFLFLFVISRKLSQAIAHFKNIKMDFFRAVFALGAQYCFFYYFQKNSLLNATVLLNTGPIFIPLFEKAFLQRAIGKSTWISLIVSFIGVIFVLQPNREIWTWMSLIGLLAGVCQGASQVIFGINAKGERADFGLLYLFFLAAVISSIPYLFERTEGVPSELSLEIIGLILALALFTILNQSFRGMAYQHSTPGRLSSFLYLSVPVAGFFDWVIFAHIPNMLSIIGAFLVILGGFLKIYLRRIILKNKDLK
jgi:drug/metabolite transporter (DMT)-like permease